MNDILPERFSRILKRIALGVTVFCLLSWIGHHYYLKKAYEREGRYTVCVIQNKVPRTSGGYSLQYVYRVNGKEYRDDVYLNAMNDFDLLEHHYLVQFVASQPQLHRVMFGMPVMKGADIPDGGWGVVPKDIIEIRYED